MTILIANAFLRFIINLLFYMVITLLFYMVIKTIYDNIYDKIYDENINICSNKIESLENKELEDEEECGICMENMKKAYIMPCTPLHYFCKDCLIKWMNNNDKNLTCPYGCDRIITEFELEVVCEPESSQINESSSTNPIDTNVVEGDIRLGTDNRYYIRKVNSENNEQYWEFIEINN